MHILRPGQTVAGQQKGGAAVAGRRKIIVVAGREHDGQTAGAECFHRLGQPIARDTLVVEEVAGQQDDIHALMAREIAGRAQGSGQFAAALLALLGGRFERRGAQWCAQMHVRYLHEAHAAPFATCAFAVISSDERFPAFSAP